MATKEEMQKAGFQILEEGENKLEAFLRANHPSVFKDGSLDVDELKKILNLEITTRARGYGLNFVGKTFANTKYNQETAMELKINEELSKNFDETKNMVIKGDNLDALKILKQNYQGKIKCIYIDPPYNTKNDNFIYNDNFKETEAELLQVFTQEEIERMEGAFKTAKSHSGWLSFIYPRLKLARDLLTEDGVIFVSIDDNEQANLKLLMDEIFGEENFIGIFPRITKKGGKSSDYFAQNHDYVLVFVKDIDQSEFFRPYHNDEDFKNQDEYFEERGFYKLNQTLDYDSLGYVKSLDYPIEINGKIYYAGGDYEKYQQRQLGNHGRADWGWRWSKDLFEFGMKNGFVVLKETRNGSRIYTKTYQKATIKKENGSYNIIYEDRTKALSTLAFINEFSNDNAKQDIVELLGKGIFDYPKPVALIKHLLKISTKPNDIILDFFAGSGTTGQAVMELNFEEMQKKEGEEAGGRKFILVQLDEKIDEKKEAYKFCIENNLEPVISSITIERLKRAGGKYNSVDTGFKVFDLIKKTFLKEEENQLSIHFNENDDLSRVYNMVVKSNFCINSKINVIIEGFIYKLEEEEVYYIINAKDYDAEKNKEKVKEVFQIASKIYVEGWTASINTTLQQYKGNEKVKIVY
jgi:adenine-specific DNA-methyltransferase